MAYNSLLEFEFAINTYFVHIRAINPTLFKNLTYNVFEYYKAVYVLFVLQMCRIILYFKL